MVQPERVLIPKDSPRIGLLNDQIGLMNRHYGDRKSSYSAKSGHPERGPEGFGRDRSKSSKVVNLPLICRIPGSGILEPFISSCRRSG